MSKLVNIAELHRKSANLASALNSGLKAKIEFAVPNLWQAVAELAPEVVKDKSWRGEPSNQVVFIEPEDIHAYIKLQSAISMFITASFLNHPQVNAVAQIKHYLEFICDTHSINHEQLITY